MNTVEKTVTDAKKIHDTAAARVRSLEAKRDEVDRRIEALEVGVETARAALRAAAGAHAAGEGSESAVNSARANLRTATSDLEAAAIESEGIAIVVEKAEAEAAEAERAWHAATARLATSRAHDVEAQALKLAGELGKLLAEHRALARSASFAATQSTGSYQEPVPGISHGERSPFKDEIDRLLTQQTADVALQ